MASVSLLSGTAWTGLGSAGHAQSPLRRGGRHAIVEIRFPYDSIDGRELWLSGYLPDERRPPVPAVLVVHGGGWSGGSPVEFSQPARALARAGLAAFDVGYQLDRPGRPGFPEQVAELETAARWVEQHAVVLGLRPGALGAIGSSAGGNLVALLAFYDHAPALSAIVTWSAPMDLASFWPMVQRSCTARGCGNHWLARDMLDYLGCKPAACPGRWARASPANDVRPGGPAWLVFTSSHELVPLRGTDLMVERLRSAGDSVELTVFPGDRHAGEYASEAMPPTIAFLRAHLDAPSFE